MEELLLWLTEVDFSFSTSLADDSFLHIFLSMCLHVLL